jgi:hypothetical protein
MLKKFVLAVMFTSVLILTGCSGSSESDQVGLVLPEENYKFYKSTDLQMQYPMNWKVMTKAEIGTKFKESFEVAFVSNFKDPFFTPTVTVEKVLLESELTSEAFADSVINQNKESLVNYAEIERQTVSTLVGNEPTLTTLVRFSGKEKIQDDLVEYVQIFLTKGEIGFVGTAAFDPTDENSEFDKMVDTLRTIKLL